MTRPATGSRDSLRLLFEMTREDNPRLYDDLLRFNKGSKRVNRLRLLAHEGLVALNEGRPGAGIPRNSSDCVPVGQNPSVAAARQTNQVFGAADMGDEGVDQAT